MIHLWCSAPPRLRSRSKSPLIRPSQTSGTSDQTVPDRSDLWSDEYVLEVRSKQPLIRRVPDRSDPWSDKFQTNVQTKELLKYCPRLKCGRNDLWSDKSAFEIVWSENDFEYEQISQYRYNIFISSIILSILNSTNKKPILKVMLMKVNRKKNDQKKITEYAIFLCF